VKLKHRQGRGFFLTSPATEPLQGDARVEETTSRQWRYRRIEKFSRDELLEATAMLVDIFLESPIFLYAFPDRDKRKQALHALFLASLKDAERFGIVDVIEGERLLSLFIYYPPDRYPMSAARVLRQLPHYLRMTAISLRGAWRLYQTQKLLDSIRPKTPHCHALFLGSIGSGKYGALLIKKSLETIDAHNWPVYLETQDPRTTKLYSRFGSKILTPRKSAQGAPTTWTMWREPAADPLGENLSDFRSINRARGPAD
jgi:hypothetical protein